MASAPISSDARDYVLHVAGGVVLSGGLLWAGGAVSALICGHHVPHGRQLAGFAALGHWRSPSTAWQAPVGPPLLYWSVTLMILVVFATAVWMGRRLVAGGASTKRPTQHEGLATRKQVARHAGRKPLVARAATLRSSLPTPRPRDIGYLLGTSAGVECWTSVEDSLLLLGPPRSGKGTSVVIPMILDSPGPVVTTSTRPDNLAVTLAARSRKGPVAVFDPQGLAQVSGVKPSLRWSLVRGCERAQTAMLRAEALVNDSGRSGVENGTFWRTQALSVVRSLLHAAALDGRPPADLYRWSHAAPGAKEAVAILADHPDATPGWDRALDATIGSDQRTRDSIWAMVANTFSPLADPAVLQAISPNRDEEFHPARFLQENGTLYLLGTASGASATATLVAALIEDVIDVARRLAATSPGARLDPPLALLLDEAANYPLPSLPSLISEGGGSGITTLAVLQSLAQARDRWGREAGGAIWDSAIVKVVLGGSANSDDLAGISRLVGDREVKETTRIHGDGPGGSSVSVSVRHRPILEPSAIRQIPVGEALLLLRSAPPIMMRLRPWTDRPDAKELAGGRRAFETAAQSCGA